MATYDNLQKMLDTILESNKYSSFVRSLGSEKYPELRKTIKSGGDEKYFNLSPNISFSGRMVCMTVSKDGRYRLGASFGKVRHVEGDLVKIMQHLTGNKPVYGTDRPGAKRNDILRCTIDTHSEEKALKMFLRFYDEVEDLITA